MKSSKISANEEHDDQNSELEYMMTIDQPEETSLNRTVQKHQSKATSWWSKTFSTVKMRDFFAVLLLFVIICGSILALISHYATRTNNSILINGKDDTTELHDWSEEQKTVIDNGISDEDAKQQLNTLNDNENNERTGDRLPQLRSYVADEKPYPPEHLGQMNIYIRKDGHRGSRSSYKRLRFPVAQYNRRRMPFSGPFMNFFPQIPIFADRLTKQTIIYSQTGGVYIIPPVINMYGQMFSVVELIAYGYASLVSSGVSPNGPINMMPFFQPTPLIGPNIPLINPSIGGFTGGLRTNFGKFSIPRRYQTESNNDYTYNPDKEDYSDNYQYGPRPPKNYKKLPKRYTTPKTTTYTSTTSTSTSTSTTSTSTSTTSTSTSTTTTSTTSTSTSTTSTTTTTTAPPLSYITKCQPAMAAAFNQVIESRKLKNRPKKVKVRTATQTIGNGILLENAYLVEFAAEADNIDHFEKIANTLQTAHQIPRSKIQKRLTIRSPLFLGVSISLAENYSMQAIEEMGEVINIYPIYEYSRPELLQEPMDISSLNLDSITSIMSHDLTGVDQVQKKLNIYGNGVTVAVVDDGIFYKHPALGGCYGSTCKVKGGYDLIGDEYSGSGKPLEDNDPFDNCAKGSHGTHVSGIIAANATAITQPNFIPDVPFTGVSPSASLLVYRIYDCNGRTASDIVTKAIHRAHEDGADIINLSLGSIIPYGESSDSVAVNTVSAAGVYIVSAMGNEGAGGFQTINDPASAAGAIAVGAVNSLRTVDYFYIIGPDGRKINYKPGTVSGGWKSNVNLTVVVNDQTMKPNDGCDGPVLDVTGLVVVFGYKPDDTCNDVVRCDKAAANGAIGCLIYNINDIAGSSSIPSGAISLEDGLYMIMTQSQDPFIRYQFLTGISDTVSTGGTPYEDTSLGLSADLAFKPQISGIGGYVYSTVSSFTATEKKLNTAYAVESGTSMATPYVAGVLALFLEFIGNPPPKSVSGNAANGICRPPLSLLKNLFQSTSNPVKIYKSLFFASTIQQGSGLVNAFQALTATSIFSPSELALNDTVRKAPSYKVNVINIGNKAATYDITHQGAAFAIGKHPNFDQLLKNVVYRNGSATVIIEPTTFELAPGQSREITLKFDEPLKNTAVALPVYSGFIYATNQITGESTHLSYAGVVGDYGNARIIVQKSQTRYVTGVLNAKNDYITDTEVPTLNGTQGISIIVVTAWPTRVFYVDVVSSKDNILNGFNSNYGLVVAANGRVLYFQNLWRNTIENADGSFTRFTRYVWHGRVAELILNPNRNYTRSKLPEGQYKIRFMALKHFGNYSIASDFEVYVSPSFNLIY